MKLTRRRRHLRPRPSRAQLRQRIDRVQATLQLFQLEWLAESQQPQPSLTRLRFLHDMIGHMRDKLASLEAWA